jgi:hypothetical protein
MSCNRSKGAAATQCALRVVADVRLQEVVDPVGRVQLRASPEVEARGEIPALPPATRSSEPRSVHALPTTTQRGGELPCQSAM